MSMMFMSSPMTSPTGRTVGSTWSSIGTSLTVYFERVVTGSDDAVVVVVVVVVVWDCARRPRARPASAQPTAELIRSSLVMVMCVCLFAFSGGCGRVRRSCRGYGVLGVIGVLDPRRFPAPLRGMFPSPGMPIVVDFIV